MGYANHVSCSVLDFCGDRISHNRYEERNISYEVSINKAAEQIQEEIAKNGLSLDKLGGIMISFDGVVDTIKGIIMVSARHKWERGLEACKDLAEKLPFEAKISINNSSVLSCSAERAFLDNLKGNIIIISWDDRTLGCGLLCDGKMASNSGGIRIYAFYIFQVHKPKTLKCGI